MLLECFVGKPSVAAQPRWVIRGWCFQFGPVEHDLAGVAGFHQLDAFPEFRAGKAVGDDR